MIQGRVLGLVLFLQGCSRSNGPEFARTRKDDERHGAVGPRGRSCYTAVTK